MKTKGTLLVLLALLPLTMAPKIALVPEGQPLAVTAHVTRDTARVDTPISIGFFVTNVTEGPLANVVLTITPLLDGLETTEVTFERVPQGCTLDDSGHSPVVVCRVGSLAGGQADQVRLNVSASHGGELTFDVTPTFGTDLNPTQVPTADEISITVLKPRR